MTDAPGPAAATPRRGPLAWQRRGFRQLTRAWVFTNLADSALFLMVAVWVKDLTGSDGAAALVFAALGLPALISPFLGQLADRMSRRRLLVWANAAMAVGLLALLAVSSPAHLWIVYVVLFAYGTVGYLTAAAQSGLVRDLLPDEELASGNGVLSTIDQAFRLISPLIGTGVYVLVGPYAVVVGTAVCFTLTSLLLLRVQVAESPPAPRAAVGRYWHELAAGFLHLFRTPLLGRLTIVIAVAFGATGLINVAIFPVMERGLGVPASTLGVLVAIQGAGSVVGGLFSATLVGRLGEGRAVGLGVALLAVACVPLAGTSLPLAIAGMLVAGFSIPVIVVAFVTLRQRLTPAQLQGRAAAASAMAFNLPQTIATLSAAALIALVDYRLLVIGTAVGAGASLLLLVVRRGARRTS